MSGNNSEILSLKAEISFHYETFREANAIVGAISPDNVKIPKDLAVKTMLQGRRVLAHIECKAGLLTFIATVDDLIDAISTAEKSLSAVKEDTCIL